MLMIHGKLPCADKVMRNWSNSNADCNLYRSTLHSSGSELEAAQDVCATVDFRGGCVLGERGDNHSPDQSSRQFVRWEMTASGVQPLVIDGKRHRVITDS